MTYFSTGANQEEKYLKSKAASIHFHLETPGRKFVNTAGPDLVCKLKCVSVDAASALL